MDDDTQVAPKEVAMSTPDADSPKQPEKEPDAAETVLDIPSTERVFLGVLAGTNRRLDRIGTGVLTLELLAGCAVVVLGLIVIRMGSDG